MTALLALIRYGGGIELHVADLQRVALAGIPGVDDVKSPYNVYGFAAEGAEEPRR
jgi:hypothetical protein